MTVLEINNKTLIFLLISIGLIVLPHAFHIPAPLFLFFTFTLGWRLLSVWKRKLIPGSFLLFMVTVTGILLLISQHQGILGRDAGTSIFVTALGLKLLEIKRERDLYLIIFLSFFVAATQFLYLQNIFMAVYILAVCCLLFATLICINSQNPDLFFSIKTAAVINLQAVPIMIIMFVFFPRIEAPRWLLYTDDKKALSGLSDTMEPGSISRLGKSDKLAFRVKFDGDIPPPAQRYWRGPIFSYTDGKRWSPTRNKDPKAVIVDPEFIGTPYSYTLMLEPQKYNWVYALEMPASFPDSLKQRSTYLLTSSNNPYERTEYRIVSYADYKINQENDSEIQINLQLPNEPTRRLTDLVHRLKDDKNDPELLVNRTLNFFNTNPFFYTLNPPLYPDNPIETFLFEGRKGFCEHYATAFVYLMRIAEIPARIVTGYQGGELNKVGNFLEIRQAHAHAWAEVWLENKGWIRVDPTSAVAPERIEQDINIDLQITTGEVNFTSVMANTGILAKWLTNTRYLWESIDYNWQRWVINYNNLSRNSFLSSLGIDSLKSFALWLSLLIGCITAVLAWFILLRNSKITDRSVKIYRQFCLKLAKVGLVRNPCEGAGNFAERVKSGLPNHAHEIDKITSMYNKIRYGKVSNEMDYIKLKEMVSVFRI